MKKLVLLVLLALPVIIFGQTNTENYVKNTTYRMPVTQGNQGAVSNDDKIESVSYYDGLGRPIQSTVQRAGGQGQDIVSVIDYDGLGRTPKSYLPVALPANGGNIRSHSGVLNLTNDYYKNTYPEDQINVSTINAYNETVYDGSWENRPLEQGAPGNSWKVDPTSDTDHTVKFEYSANTVSIQQGDTVIVGDDVLLFSINYPTNGDLTIPELQLDGLYTASELYKSTVKDENWTPSSGNDHTSVTFKNRKGQVILKRTYDNNVAHDTYYVYDKYDNLTFVLPPLAVDEVQSSLGIDDFTQTISGSDFVTGTTSSGTGELVVSLSGNVLTTNFNVTVSPSQQVRNGNYGIQMSLPDIYIGQLPYTPQPGETPIEVQVASGYLYISGTTTVSTIDATLQTILPNTTGIVDPSIIEKLGYQYHYDDRNRLIEKRIPQKDWEFIVYDPLDRPVLVQSGILRENSEWLFTKYDALGRVVYTGLHIYDVSCDSKQTNSRNSTNKWTGGTTTKTTTTSTATSRGCQRRALQNIVNNQASTFLHEQKSSSGSIDGTTIYYTNQSYPREKIELHTINYYDDYVFDWSYGGSAGLINPSTTVSFGQTQANNTKGLATGSKVRVLDTDGWIISYIVYDHKRRPIYNGSYNKELLVRDISKTELDFVGQPLQSEREHTFGSQASIVTKDFFTYDPNGRLLTQKQQIDNQPLELIVKNEYDSLGMLSRKRTGGNATSEVGLQEIDYTYNIRGWMKGINEDMVTNPGVATSDLFGFRLSYDQLQSNSETVNSPLYNGNISETLWRTLNTDSNVKGYAYSYDALNRLKDADFVKRNSSGPATFQFNGDHQETIGQYDKNGNILSLRRTGPIEFNSGPQVWDDLDYYYDGNQLEAVRELSFTSAHSQEGFEDGTNTSQEYLYDRDGNLIEDRNKGINTITYNHLHLPTNVATNEGTVNYTYDAIGTKLKKTVNSHTAPTVTKMYLNGFIYTDNVLSMISQPEGYIEKIGNNFEYAYNHVDHLGNVRLTYKDLNNNGSISSNEIIEEKNYFPFGLQHKGYNYIVQGENSAATQFGYNGMENNPELGLEILDFGARNYDPALGKWMNIDPLAEQMRRHSPYNFAFDNPVFYIDPDGMAPTNTNYADNGGTQSAFNFGDEEEEVEEEKEENENDSSHSQSANNGSDSNSDISDDSKDQSSSNNDCETPFDCFLQKFINALSFNRLATIEDAENKSDDYAEILDKVEKMADDSETIFSIYSNGVMMMTPGLGLVGTSTFRTATGTAGWLSFHEGVGHTIARHVGKSDIQLFSRLFKNTKITGASTFSNQAIAETVISYTISAQRATVNTWLKSGSTRNLVLEYIGSSAIGRGVMRGQSSVSNLSNARIVLKPNGNGNFHILTAFPK